MPGYFFGPHFAGKITGTLDLVEDTAIEAKLGSGFFALDMKSEALAAKRDEWERIMRRVADSDPDGAEDGLNQLKDAVAALSKNTGAKPGSGISPAAPWSLVKDNLEPWKGDAKNSFQTFHSRLGTALTEQLDIAELLTSALDTHITSVAAVQEELLNICHDTIAALKERIEDRRSEKKNKFQQALEGFGAAMTFAGAAGGGAFAIPAGLAGFAAYIVSERNKIEGKHAELILEQFEVELDKAVAKARESQESMCEVLDRIQSIYFYGIGQTGRPVPPALAWQSAPEPTAYSIRHLPEEEKKKGNTSIMQQIRDWGEPEEPLPTVPLPDPVDGTNGPPKPSRFTSEDFVLKD